MKVCKNCLLPENFPNAQIDGDELCVYCRKGIKLPDYSHEEPRFNSLIQEIKKENPSPYDCLVCYSGGKDSTYTLIQIKKKYRMNPVAFTLDNGFVSQKAKENIACICAKLGVDLIAIKPDPDRMNAVFKVSLEHKIFSENVVSRMSAACYACITFVNYQAINLALDKGLRIIVSGFTHGQVPKALFILNPEFLKKTFSETRRRLSSSLSFDPDEFYPSVDFSKLDKPNVLYKVNPLLFEKYNESRILSEIKKYGWERPRDVDNCSSNCLMNRVGNYYHYKIYGYHPYQHEISSLIRVKALSKEEGQKMVSDLHLGPEAEKIIKKLKLKL